MVKQKTRFDGLDVAAMVAQIRQILGHKLANVYDGVALSTSISGDSSGKSTFLFKLANPSGGGSGKDGGGGVDDNASNTTNNSNRCMLLIESGVRFHTTTFYASGGSNNSAPPSPFAMKLRKHMRNLRLENVTQLGNLDRVVDFRFGSGAYAHHVIVELYGLGNVILTNDQYVILALLRVHDYTNSNDSSSSTADGNKSSKTADQGGVKVRVGNVYPVTYATTLGKQIVSSNEGQDGNEGRDVTTTKQSILEMNGEEAYLWAKQELQAFKDKQALKAAEPNKGGKKKSQKKKKDSDASANLKMILLKPNSGVFHYGPSLIEHCILMAGDMGGTGRSMEPNTKFTLETLEDVMPPSSWEKLVHSLKVEGPKVIEDFNSAEGKGYILYKDKPASVKEDSKTLSEEGGSANHKIPHSDKLFEEFQPHLLKQHQNRPHLTYNNFSMAVDEFYSLLEGQKRAVRAEAAEQSAMERLNKIKRDQSKRHEGLEIEMVKVKEHAQLVEMHSDDVDKALGVINSALDSGMDWDDLEELVEVEKANMNPIALLIKKLKLDSDEIVLSLADTSNWDSSSSSGDDAPPIADVTLSLKEGAYGNARKMYDRYRSSKDKAAKTIEASEKALKAAEANAQRQIEQARQKKKMTYSVMMQPQRKQHWFEKFHWFITSDNYLCIGGRDAQQNEQLVKKYLRPGDAYLHADVHGAPTCILRAKRRRTAKGATEVLPLSDQALRDAGNFAICRSSAWGSRMVTSAWWVESHQVSKTAPTGEYLTVGSFMIRGKKNFLPPVQLEMGLGVLFRLGDDASVVRHANDRRDHALMALEQCDEIIDELKFGQEQNPDPARSTKRTKSTMQANGNESEDIKDNVMASFLKAGTKEKKQNKASINSVLEAVDTNENTKYDSPPLHSDDTKKDAANEEQIVSKPKKKGLSAKERKLIKKYGSLEAAEEALAKIRQEEEEARKKKEALKAQNEKAKVEETESSHGNNVRGKKSKMKKMAKKYADQDDEDRELALVALQGGSKKKKTKKGSRILPADSKSQKIAAAETTALLIKNAEEFVDKLPSEVSAILAKCVSTKASDEEEIVRWDKFDAEVLEQLIDLKSIDAQKAAAGRLLQLTETTRVDNFSASLAGIIRTIHKYGYEGIQESDVGSENKQRKTKAEKEAEKEAWRDILAEDGIIEDDGVSDGPVDDTAEISKLTGKPVPEDVILYAIPVCAPYATLAQYKYRVKLTPGSQKRGKASKQCVEMFYASDTSSKKKGGTNNGNRYVDMIKAVNDNEWVQAMCGDVKISAAGASKTFKKQKAAKNGKKKK